MISAGTHTCFLSDITINRAERQRRALDPKHITRLAESLAIRGLIHPIVLDQNLVLAAGECRVEAARSLGWDQIEFRYIEELDPLERELVELEENTHRQDLTWQEQNDAVARLYEIHKTLAPDATDEEISEKINRSKTNLSQHLAVKEERLRNAALNDSATFRTAREKAKAAKDRRAAAEDVHGSPGKPCTPILPTSFHDWAPTYTGPKFSIIHCDFPYGINAQESGANPAGYDDSPEVFLSLLKTLALHLDNFCASSAHMIFWYGAAQQSMVWENLKLLSGFTFDEVPIIWHKADGKGIAPDPLRRPRRVYETAFFGWRGDARLVHLRDNLFSAPTERAIHPHEKSALMLYHFLSMIVDETSRIFDPTCGSGSALRAAKVLGCRAEAGLELNDEWRDAANSLLDKTPRGDV